MMQHKYITMFLGWIALISVSLAWNLHQLELNTLNNAAATARSNLAKDIGFRNWASSHGGVYVQPTTNTPANPYLKVPERDVTTTTGMKLTLMNPAYVVREVQQAFSGDKQVVSHLTSLKLLNPDNKPDEWETRALKSFDQGNKEVLEINLIGDQPYLRLMQPLPVTEGCLKCHSSQGYKVGDVRGGIGAYVRLQPYTAVQAIRSRQLSLSHGIIWLIGLLGLGGAYRREKYHLKQRLVSEQHIQQQLKFSVSLNKIAKSVVDHNDARLILEEVAELIGTTLNIDRTLFYHARLGKLMAIRLAEWLNPLHPNTPTSLSTYPLNQVAGLATAIRQSQGCLTSQHNNINPLLLNDDSGELLHKRMKILSLLCYPYAFHDEEYHLLVLNQIHSRHEWTTEEIHFLDSVCQILDVAMKKIHLTEEHNQATTEIHNLAYYDPLTRLPNRRLMMDKMKSALLKPENKFQYGAVLFIDLDNFKTLNDTLGHEYGDMLLIETATRITSCVRKIDTVARLGGDDFVVLLEAVDDHSTLATQKVALIAEKIRAVLTAPYQLNDREYISTTSIGISLYRGNIVSADDLFKHADMAMYRAKSSGRNAVRFFDPEMQHTVETRAALETDLRLAVSAHQLQLHYQIQVDNEQRPLGAEALVRWLHPTRGMVPPAQFIPIAEEGSLIIDIGDWVLETACRQLASWSENENICHLTLSVNVSAQQFKQSDFVGKIATLIHTHELDASRLKLELTESVVLNDVTDMINKMHALKALRVRLSLDDFGTGYSSLSYLKQLPLDQIKIDQSFVRDMTSDQNDAIMVQTIIDMTRNFRLNVIAEGVETEAQLSLLKHLGCMAYQGYYFSKPVPPDQFEALLLRI